MLSVYTIAVCKNGVFHIVLYNIILFTVSVLKLNQIILST